MVKKEDEIITAVINETYSATSMLFEKTSKIGLRKEKIMFLSCYLHSKASNVVFIAHLNIQIVLIVLSHNTYVKCDV